jgi:hypothetical protein
MGISSSIMKSIENFLSLQRQLIAAINSNITVLFNRILEKSKRKIKYGKD